MIRVVLVAAVALATVLAVRAYDAWRAPPLSLWHTEAPEELDADAIDASDWPAWLAAESQVMREVQRRVTEALPAADRHPANRYFAGSPMHPANFAADWNRSHVLMPAGPPRGGAVMLHGLTDSPYSLRHLGEFYRRQGFVVVMMRLPGHGTVPAGLTRVRWQDWRAATRLAVRHTRQLAGPDAPLHLVGYSNGGALALNYALDAQSDTTLPKPTQLVLLSPMVGITRFARFAGVLGWPSVFPGFAKAAWLDTLPEYNPFKYNSFPVNGARQSSLLVAQVREEFDRRARQGRLADFPPVLAFQSVIDATVSTDAVWDLFQQLPGNGHELVFFDRNRAALADPLIRPDSTRVLDRVDAAGTRKFGFTLITATGTEPGVAEARHTAAGESAASITALRGYPRDTYSLSHVALPFPVDDALYGSEPRADEFYGVRLGAVAVRGERGTLVVGVETLMRSMCNPFFDYQLQRIAATLPR